MARFNRAIKEEESDPELQRLQQELREEEEQLAEDEAANFLDRNAVNPKAQKAFRDLASAVRTLVIEQGDLGATMSKETRSAELSRRCKEAEQAMKEKTEGAPAEGAVRRPMEDEMATFLANSWVNAAANKTFHDLVPEAQKLVIEGGLVDGGFVDLDVEAFILARDALDIGLEEWQKANLKWRSEELIRRCQEAAEEAQKKHPSQGGFVGNLDYYYRVAPPPSRRRNGKGRRRSQRLRRGHPSTLRPLSPQAGAMTAGVGAGRSRSRSRSRGGPGAPRADTPCENCGRPGTTLWVGIFCSGACEEQFFPVTYEAHDAHIAAFDRIQSGFYQRPEKQQGEEEDDEEESILCADSLAYGGGEISEEVEERADRGT